MSENNKESEVVVKLEKFVYFMANRSAIEDVIGMQVDDIIGELFEEIIKGIRYYSKKGLPDDQLMKILKTMCDHRVSELKYKYLVTSRKAVLNQLSMEDHAEMLSRPSDSDNVEEVYESKDRVIRTRELLSEQAQQIFDAVIFSTDPKLTEILTDALRNKKGSCSERVHYWQVSKALGINQRVVRASFEEIKEAYQTVCDEDDCLEVYVPEEFRFAGCDSMSL